MGAHVYFTTPYISIWSLSTNHLERCLITHSHPHSPLVLSDLYYIQFEKCSNEVHIYSTICHLLILA